MKKSFTLSSFLFLLLVSVWSGEDKGVSVRVRVEGFSDNKGLCRLLIYSHPKGFPDSMTEAALCCTSPIKDKAADFSLNLVSGKYAFSVLHDGNENGKMDKTWYGKPSEGFGASNNPPSRKGPPAFDECVLNIDTHCNSFLIRINYL